VHFEWGRVPREKADCADFGHTRSVFWGAWLVWGVFLRLFEELVSGSLGSEGLFSDRFYPIWLKSLQTARFFGGAGAMVADPIISILTDAWEKRQFLPERRKTVQITRSLP
jgi:hypothetical protein